MNSKIFAHVCREIRLTKCHRWLGQQYLGAVGHSCHRGIKLGLGERQSRYFDSDFSCGWTHGHVAPFKAGSKIL